MVKKLFPIFLLFFILLLATGVLAEVKAFPSAYGGGSLASGGRGGVLVRVNTLNPSAPLVYDAASDSYSGGIRAALGNSLNGRPRYIVFDVSGNIDISSGDLLTSRSDITIFGQSAPRGGITLHGDNVQFTGGDNLIIRYLRSRNGKQQANPISDDQSTYGFKVASGGDNIIFDHVSASWGGDKALLIGSNQEVSQFGRTVQRSLLSDSHTYMQMSMQNPANFDRHGDLSVYYNLLGRGSQRTPNIGGTNGYIEVINNVVQAGGSNTKMGVIQWCDDCKVNWDRNYYQVMGSGVVTNELQISNGKYNVNNERFDQLQLHSRGNYYQTNSRVVLDGTENSNKNDNAAIWTYRLGGIPDDTPMPYSYFVEQPFNKMPNPPPFMTAQQAYESVLNDVGANAYFDDNGYVQKYVDSWDGDVIAGVRAETMAQAKYSRNWILPNIPSSTRPASYDTDKDGMSDAWERRTFGNLNQGYNGDHDGDGYTNIEEFMNQVDGNLPQDSTTNTGSTTTNSNTNTSSTTNTASFGLNNYFIRETNQVLSHGQQIDISENQFIDISYYGTIESVIIFVNGKYSHTEQGTPYTVVPGEQLSIGTNIITAVPYDINCPYDTGTCSGTPGQQASITLEVYDGKNTQQSPTTTSNLLVSNVEILELGEDGFVVGYTTNIPTSGQLLYGTSGILGKGTSVHSTQTTEHQIQVSGLQEGTVYFYRVTGSDANGNTYNSQISLTRTYGSSATTTQPTTSTSKPLIQLNTLKAFPDLWGEGADKITGGRDGIKFFVTELSDSNKATYHPASNGNDAYYTGTLRGALFLQQPRQIIPRVSGNINLNDGLYNLGRNNGDYSYHGHLAPPGGLRIINGRHRHTDTTNVVLRFLGARINNQAGISVTQTLSFVRGSTIAVDHASLAWAGDEIFSIWNNQPGMYDTIIAQHNIMGQAREGHNTGSVLGFSCQNDVCQNGQNYDTKLSWQNNVYVAVTHRTPNYGSTTNGEARIYNNVIYDFSARLSRIHGGDVDMGYNYYKENPNNKINAQRLNRIHEHPEDPRFTPKVWTGYNFVSRFQETPKNNDRNTWTSYPDSTKTLSSSYFRNSPLSINSQFGYQPVSAQEAYDELINEREVGYNRQVDKNGNIVFGHDSVDTAYLNGIKNSQNVKVDESNWVHPNVASNQPYTDTNWNGIYDGFEQEHNIQSADQIIKNWEFDDYVVVNNAGYDAFEIWSAYAAGDFERLAEMSS